MYTTSQRETSLGALLKRMRFRLAARNRSSLTVQAACQALVAVIADNTKPARCDGNPRDDTEMRHPGETDDGRVHQLFGRRCQGRARGGIHPYRRTSMLASRQLGASRRRPTKRLWIVKRRA